MMYLKQVEYPSKTNIYLHMGELGSGSLGRIVLVREKSSSKLFALKIINKQKMEDCRAELNVEREILIHMKLNHKNILKMMETFEDDQNLYILLEYCSGGNLYERLNKSLLTEQEAFIVFYSILSGIDYLHSKGIMHRDIKPDNVLIHEDGTYKICDFGWAIPLESDQTYPPELCGTNQYMPPEVLQSQTHKLDIWSLGVVMFELLHGNTQLNQMSQRITEDLQILLYAMLSKPINQRPTCKQIFLCKWMRRMMKSCNLFNKYENELMKTKINKNVQIKTLGNSCFDLKYKSANVSETSSLTQSNQSAPPMIPNTQNDLFDSVPIVEDPGQPQN